MNFTRKFLNNNSTLAANIIGTDTLKVFIDGYAYTAVTERNVSLTNNVQTVTMEDGFIQADHAYREPADLSYTIIVSKVDTSEYIKLFELYKNKRIFHLKSVTFECSSMMINSFKISDDSFDTLKINISVIEILEDSATTVSPYDSRFQMINGADESYNTTVVASNDSVTSDETASIDNAINSQVALSDGTVTTQIQNTLFTNILVLASPILIPASVGYSFATQSFSDTDNQLKNSSTAVQTNSDHVDNVTEQYSSIF